MENAQPEPSMEEILASIRRIISEDDEDAAPQDAAPNSVKPSLVKSTPAPTPEPAPSVAELESRQSDAASAHLETEDVEMIKKNVAEAISDEIETTMLDETSASAASSAFESLSQSVRVSEGPGKTLEDIVTQMLQPMVKDWLDANLPAIVEDKVEEEVQRVARRRR